MVNGCLTTTQPAWKRTETSLEYRRETIVYSGWTTRTRRNRYLICPDAYRDERVFANATCSVVGKRRVNTVRNCRIRESCAKKENAEVSFCQERDFHSIGTVFVPNVEIVTRG